jgi:hypothetical protein
MFARALHAFFRFATTREFFLVVGLALALLTGAMLLEQLRFVREFSSEAAALQEAEGIVDGLAGVLVAAGVFLESRDTLRRIAFVNPPPMDTVEARVSEISAQNGMGILMVGLLMEVGTLLIGLPKRVVDTHGFERAIFGACALLSVVTLVILYDFVVDAILTYRMKREALPPGALPPEGH